MEKIILYSTGCPQCKVLKSILDKRGITYEVCSDKGIMMSMGLMAVPQLRVDGKLLSFKEAIDWAKGGGQ